MIAMHEVLDLPIRNIGVGEEGNDPRPFDTHAFLEVRFARGQRA